jgi:hypothetical protein
MLRAFKTTGVLAPTMEAMLSSLLDLPELPAAREGAVEIVDLRSDTVTRPSP